MAQTDRSQVTQSGDHGEASQPGGAQSASGAAPAPLTQQVRSGENLVATMPITFVTDLKASLRKSYFESEQEARRINDMIEDAHEKAEECREKDTSEFTRQG